MPCRDIAEYSRDVPEYCRDAAEMQPSIAEISQAQRKHCPPEITQRSPRDHPEITPRSPEITRDHPEIGADAAPPPAGVSSTRGLVAAETGQATACLYPPPLLVGGQSPPAAASPGRRRRQLRRPLRLGPPAGRRTRLRPWGEMQQRCGRDAAEMRPRCDRDAVEMQRLLPRGARRSRVVERGRDHARSSEIVRD